MLEGVDVSNHQGEVDWQQVAASGKAFAFVKATERATFVDPYLAQNWAGMKAAGLVRGCYHFARPSINDPEKEAAFFVSTMANVGGVEPGDLLALDLEDQDVPDGKDLTDWALRWLRAVEQATGCKPLIYSGWWYLEPHIRDQKALEGYTLWMASYGPQWPWGTEIWQYSETGSVPGVNGNCDLDRYDGSVEGLRALGKPVTDSLQTCIDVVHGWGERLGKIINPTEQIQASAELLDVAKMLEGMR